MTLRFNGHFLDEPGIAGVYWSKGWWRQRWQLDYWSYKSCKAPVKSSPPTNQHPVFLQAGCPSCRPTNGVKALKWKISQSMDLLTSRSPGGLPILSLTTKGSCLPWGRIAMPLISPLMSVAQTRNSAIVPHAAAWLCAICMIDIDIVYIRISCFVSVVSVAICIQWFDTSGFFRCSLGDLF